MEATMTKCNFQLPFSGNSAELLRKVKQGIEKTGGTFNGDKTSDSFSVKSQFIGKVECTYSINDQNVNIIITKKPLYIGCKKIKKELQRLLKIEFKKVQEKENEWLRERRIIAGIEEERKEAENEKESDNPEEPPKVLHTMGLALSGGGIRSATFNLGLLQALEKYGVLKSVDYLSTVSGGGYIGSCLTWFMSKLKGKEKKDPRDFPFGTSREDHTKLGGKVLAWLRAYGKYITPGEGLNIWAFIGAVLSGILVNLLIMVPVFLLLFFGLSQKAPIPIVDEFIKYFDPCLQDFLVFHLLFLLGLGLLALFLLKVLLFAIFSHLSFLRKPYVQKWIRMLSGGLLKWCVLFVVVGTIPTIYHLLLDKMEAWTPAIMSGISLSGIITMFGGGRKCKKRNETKGLRPFLVSLGLSLLVYSLFLWFYHLALCYISLNWFLLITMVLSVVLALMADVNHVSMHRFYRNRLMKAYMSDEIKVGSEDGNSDEDTFDNPDQFYLADIPITSAPYHIINTYIQTPGSKDSRLSGRGGDNFIFSPLYCGSDSSTYIETGDYIDGKMDLATAFAISGAAVSPNTYATRSRPLSFIMTLLNIRLGYWIRNPLHRVKRFKLLYLIPRWYKHMFAEMFGKGLKETNKQIHLSDGGHFENLGLYELIRRRCKYIIVSDAGADKNYNFSDLAKAIEMVRLDFGAKIEIDTSDLMLKKETKRSDRAFTYATIDYGNEETGYLIYIKTTLIEELPEDIYSYQRSHDDFPDQSTMDQFYDEPQFEAYRELGFQLGRKLSYHLDEKLKLDEKNDKKIKPINYEKLKESIIKNVKRKWNGKVKKKRKVN
jgi:hypothetical protein